MLRNNTVDKVAGEVSEDATDNPEDECDLSNDDTVNYRDLNDYNLVRTLITNRNNFNLIHFCQ